MKEISIVTDGGSSWSKEEAEALGVGLVPLSLSDREGRDASHLSPDELYEKMDQGDQFTTSQPSFEAFMTLYRELYEADIRSIVSIHVSAILSGTFEQAELAKQKIQEELPELEISIIDSLGISTAQQAVVAAALRLLDEGFEGDALEEKLEAFAQSIKLYAAFDSLEHLQKGGRVFSIIQNLGQLLKIKPIIGLNKGELKLFDKTRTQKKLYAQLLEKLETDIAQHGWPLEIRTIYTAQKELAEELINKIKEMPGSESVVFPEPVEGGAVIGVHAGPNAFGMSYSLE